MKKLYRYLQNYSTEIREINQLLVSAFVFLNELKVSKNKLIKELNTLSHDSTALTSFSNLIMEVCGEFSIELLIELFEFVISPVDKEINGAVYTPERIRAYLVESSLSHYPVEEWGNLSYADISCGCGGFFISLADYIRSHLDISLEDLYPHFYGIDIENYSIERTKILLSLYALLNHEDVAEMRFNLCQGNSLSFDWSQLDCFQDSNQGFDVILGNPPYVTSSRISEDSKKLISRWEVASIGKVDLYIPFTQIAIELLRPYGILGYISVNSFYRSLNGRALRRYLSNLEYSLFVVDFLGDQVFKGRSTYTCLLLLQKKRGLLHYMQCDSKSLSSLKNIDFTSFYYNDLDDHHGWQLHQPLIGDIIRRIQSVGIPLGDYCNIRNGFATLKNDVYILNYTEEDSVYYYTETQGKGVFKIEKDICRDVIKPNILHRESDIPSHIEKMIFPYYKRGEKMTVMSEEYLSEKFPCAYKYLTAHRQVLAQRDKGNKQYEEWFAFGRSQALDICGSKLLFPYLSDRPRFVLSDIPDLLFYNGYALVSDDIRKLKILQRILSSSIFWFYISHTSKPYGNNFFALAKNYIKNFGIPIMSSKEEEILLQQPTQSKIDKFLENLYKVDLN